MMRSAPFFLVLAVFAWSPAGKAGGVNGNTTRPISDGTYHCKAGSSRLMLTLGDMQISGSRFTFTTPTGEVSSGSYATGPQRYIWSGDIGAINSSQIVDSGRNQDADDSFWFQYKARPESLPTSASCS